MRRRTRSLLTVLLTALAALLLAAPAASAHTELESSAPADGTRLARTPAAVRLTFSEPVELDDVHVTVGGRQLAVSRSGGGGRAVEVTVPKTSGRSDLTLTWQVLDMEDGHPTSGTLSFRLTAKAAPAAAAPAAPEPSETVRTVWAAVRWAGYLALAVYVGGLAFLALLWPQGALDRSTRRVLTLSWATGLAASLLAPGLQEAYGTLGSLGAVFRRAAYADLLGTQVGVVAACRVLMWVLAAIVLAAVLQGGDRTARSPGWRVGALAVALGLLRTTSMTGHNSEGTHPGWGAVADVVHLLGVSLWLGGLALLLTGVLPRRRPAELKAVVSGYSTLAGVSVAAIVAAGAVLTWQVVGSFGALLHTGYGRLLLLKLAVLALVLLLAQRSRGWVRTRLDIAVLLRGDRLTVRPFVHSVAAETGLVLVVLAATSLLVTSAPGR
ncbi:copper resistance CopC/CopD family protein [Streptomyces cylindrosporus]|uniref:Copper resistance protein CopC/CopD n=1 Tax=Streptomyces cylindrosporus TaxID=2927583 RepID=A0ABS9Y3N4_9ACTN|nr:copper resistance protein CopC [Streptomyces cylindrosporus]MCI3271815.1 copper resistance protein CopC/CopD [Streptomyces cylindrosporus]